MACDARASRPVCRGVRRRAPAPRGRGAQVVGAARLVVVHALPAIVRPCRPSIPWSCSRSAACGGAGAARRRPRARARPRCDAPVGEALLLHVCVNTSPSANMSRPATRRDPLGQRHHRHHGAGDSSVGDLVPTDGDGGAPSEEVHVALGEHVAQLDPDPRQAEGVTRPARAARGAARRRRRRPRAGDQRPGERGFGSGCMAPDPPGGRPTPSKGEPLDARARGWRSFGQISPPPPVLSLSSRVRLRWRRRGRGRGPRRERVRPGHPYSDRSACPRPRPR